MEKIKKIIAILWILFVLIPRVSAQDNGSAIQQLQQSANSFGNFASFFFSDLFLWFWVLVIVAIVFVPFGIKGMVDAYRWADKRFFKPGKGFLYATQKLPNDNLRHFWVRPTGKMMKFKAIDGRDIEESVKLGKDWVVRDGNTPCIFLDEHNHQVQIGVAWTLPSISQEEVTRSLKSAYDFGKLIGSIDFFNDIKTWILIGIIVASALGVANIYQNYGNGQQIANNKISEDSIAQKVAIAFLNITSRGNVNTPINGVPTVGGR